MSKTSSIQSTSYITDIETYKLFDFIIFFFYLNRYCGRRTKLYACITNFTETLNPCLNETELAAKVTALRVISKLMEFICNREGDQIALFIAEKGPECFQERKDDLIECGKNVYNSVNINANETNLSLSNFTSNFPFALTQSQCK